MQRRWIYQLVMLHWKCFVTVFSFALLLFTQFLDSLSFFMCFIYFFTYLSVHFSQVVLLACQSSSLCRFEMDTATHWIALQPLHCVVFVCYLCVWVGHQEQLVKKCVCVCLVRGWHPIQVPPVSCPVSHGMDSRLTVSLYWTHHCFSTGGLQPKWHHGECGFLYILMFYLCYVLFTITALFLSWKWMGHNFEFHGLLYSGEHPCLKNMVLMQAKYSPLLW